MNAELPCLPRAPSEAPPASWQTSLVEFRPDTLPPLPLILSPTLDKLARTHKSSISSARDATRSDGHLTELASNGGLEWVGDAILYWAVSKRLRELFKYAHSGYLTQIRHRLVSNRTLSHLAWHYGLVQRLITTPSNCQNGREAISNQQKTAANAFEAYIGAVVESFADSSGGTRAIEHFIALLLQASVFPPIRDLLDELNQPPKILTGEEKNKKRRLQTMLGETTDPMAGGVDASPRTSSLTATHAWKDVFVGNRTWSSTLFVHGKEVGTGLGPKIVDARDAALTVYIERAEKATEAA